MHFPRDPTEVNGFLNMSNSQEQVIQKGSY